MAISNRRNVAKAKVTVFYDGSCPLCRKEISHYQRLDVDRRLNWCDISRSADQLKLLDISLEQAMKELHVLDIHGQLKTRAEAFITLWQQLPYYRWLARLVERLQLVSVMNRAYDIFARWRFRRWQARWCAAQNAESRQSEPNQR